MELLRELMQIQHERGCLSDETLREVSKQRTIPLYHLQGLRSFYTHFRSTPSPKVCVQVCRDVTCAMSGCRTLTGELRAELQSRDDVEIEEVSCLGRCDSAPALAINDVFVATDEPLGLVRAVADGLSEAPQHGQPSSTRDWQCDPYESAATRYGTVLELAGDDLATACIDRLSGAGLRGMGGAGFPTGRKWELVRNEPASPKYVICNADESEPGTFKDRAILEELPHLVIEGMLLAGLTVGAERGIIYLRHEYAREQQALDAALAHARQRGVLGENAAGSGSSFDIEIFVSPGGYILGEETALLEALEDKRGEPRNKPPYPGQHGLWGKPTLINNVESFALATSIIHHGADWWHAQGRDGFSGLKVVSVSGDVLNPGVYEVAVGTPVSDIIELAGGLPEGRQLQAFLPGGASSNFLPADKADTPLDFDAMKNAGSMLGTGALIVISDRHNLFDLATSIVTFFRNESCGKCVPCRLGTQSAVQLLERVADGSAPASALDSLTDLGETLEQTSICGLGQVALNPVLSILATFPDSGTP